MSDIKFKPGDRVAFKDSDFVPGTVRTWESKIGFDYFWLHYRPRGWQILSPRQWYVGWRFYEDDLESNRARDRKGGLVSVAWDGYPDGCDGYDPEVLVHVYDR